MKSEERVLEVVSATSPCRDPQSAAGKVSWMQRHLEPYSILYPMVWNSGGAVFDPAGNVVRKVRNFIEGIELL